jgi:hypothetical protein
MIQKRHLNDQWRHAKCEYDVDHCEYVKTDERENTIDNTERNDRFTVRPDAELFDIACTIEHDTRFRQHYENNREHVKQTTVNRPMI